MSRNKNLDEAISVSKFIDNYILPFIGGYLTDDKKVFMNNKMSHLDLTELNIPGVKRIPDECKSKYKNGEIIAVKAKGMNHKGTEVHYYLRPQLVMQKEITKGTIIKDYNDGDYLDDYAVTSGGYMKENTLTGEEKYKQRMLKKQNEGKELYTRSKKKRGKNND